MKQPNPIVEIGEAKFGQDLPFSLIAGPCALESRAQGLEVAQALKEMCAALNIGLVFKASYDKANRTSGTSARGSGMQFALPVFAEIKKTYGLPILTDVHEPAHCAPVATVADALQIPAFLCRQTDLLVAAAKTGKVVNVKKGQFLAPWDTQHIVKKILNAGNGNILLTERGASFGYNTLVVDMRSLPIMAETGAPVIFDATHAVQQPSGQGASTGGERRFIPHLARAALSVGVAGLFLETHPDPDKAISDGPNQIPLRHLRALLKEFLEFDQLAKQKPIQSL